MGSGRRDASQAWRRRREILQSRVREPLEPPGGGDQQLRGVRGTGAPTTATSGGRWPRRTGGVVVDADGHATGVGVSRRRGRGSPCPTGVREVVVTRAGVPVGATGGRVAEMAEEFLLLSVHATTAAPPNELAREVDEIAELGVRSGWAVPSTAWRRPASCSRRRATEDGPAIADRCPDGSAPRTTPRRLEGPPQRRLGVAAGGRVDQALQRRRQAGCTVSARCAPHQTGEPDPKRAPRRVRPHPRKRRAPGRARHQRDPPAGTPPTAHSAAPSKGSSEREEKGYQLGHGEKMAGTAAS